MVFHEKMTFDKALYNERLVICDSLKKLENAYIKFCQSIWSVGLRLTNERWEQFIKKNGNLPTFGTTSPKV